MVQWLGEILTNRIFHIMGICGTGHAGLGIDR